MYIIHSQVQLHSYEIAAGPSDFPIIVASSKTSNHLTSVYIPTSSNKQYTHCSSDVPVNELQRLMGSHETEGRFII